MAERVRPLEGLVHRRAETAGVRRSVKGAAEGSPGPNVLRGKTRLRRSWRREKAGKKRRI